MSKHKKKSVSLRAKICTVISGTIMVAILTFSLYAEMYADSPSFPIKSIDNWLWGLLMVFAGLCAVGILYWGYSE